MGFYKCSAHIYENMNWVYKNKSGGCGKWVIEVNYLPKVQAKIKMGFYKCSTHFWIYLKGIRKYLGFTCSVNFIDSVVWDVRTI